jgi:hypothetical protein
LAEGLAIIQATSFRFLPVIFGFCGGISGVGLPYVAKIEPESSSGFLVTIAPSLSGEQRLVSHFFLANFFQEGPLGGKATGERWWYWGMTIAQTVRLARVLLKEGPWKGEPPAPSGEIIYLPCSDPLLLGKASCGADGL